MKTISTAELADHLNEYRIFDVRTPEEYAEGHIPGAINRPLADLKSWVDEVEEGMVFTCRSGGRSENACMQAKFLAGKDVINHMGGFLDWQASGQDVETGA